MKKIISCIALTVLLIACSKTETDLQPDDSGNSMIKAGKGGYSPTVTTYGASSISRFNATTGGNVSKSGNGNSTTDKGVCYGVNPNPTTADNKRSAGPGPGNFSFILSGLSPSTLYYVRAYAQSGATTIYGNQVSFTTLATNFGTYGTVTDIDGNVYTAIIVGSQIWLKENLNTTRYRNGDPITYGTGNWSSVTTGLYCDYNNDETNSAIYGRLYNWYAVNDSRNIAPPGYHVATGSDWTTLINYFGGMYVAAGNLKEYGIEHWMSPNLAYLNESGFDALPGGYRASTTSDFIGYMGGWWSSTGIPGTNSAKYLKMYWEDENTWGSFGSSDSGGWNFKSNGYSIRCVKDQN